jgi:RimJ/RimL family protein N-acetyltransferase
MEIAEVVLETPRLRMRAFRGEDLDAYAAMSADPEVMRYLGAGVTLTRAEAWRSMAAILGHWRLLGYGMWALELKASGEFIGRAGFLDPPGWPAFELGWVLARPHWGQGYATEAATRARDYAFNELARDMFISLIRHGNERSARVAERLGARLTGEVELLGSPTRVYETRRP